jgi:GNAT superfamily N-acetyltransferase
VSSGDRDWADLVEAGIFLVAGLPGLRRLPFAGLQARSMPVSDPLASILGAARLSPEEAPRVARDVVAYFAARRQAFSWRVGPSSRPASLAEHLHAAGMRPGITIRGLVMPALRIPADPLPTGMVVRPARPDDQPALAGLIEQAYPASRELASRLCALYLQPAAAGLVRVSVAEIAGEPGLRGMGVTYDFPGRPIAALAGAAVLPAHRHRGFYRALLADRLREARRRGIDQVVLQAVSTTSAPICRRHGFEDRFEIQVLEWHPAPTGDGA